MSKIDVEYLARRRLAVENVNATRVHPEEFARAVFRVLEILASQGSMPFQNAPEEIAIFKAQTTMLKEYFPDRPDVGSAVILRMNAWLEQLALLKLDKFLDPTCEVVAGMIKLGVAEPLLLTAEGATYFDITPFADFALEAALEDNMVRH